VQFLTLFGSVVRAAKRGICLGAGRKAAVFFGGRMTGTTGVNYAHELMPNANKRERFWAMPGDGALSHFRSNICWCTTACRHPRESGTTARYNEGVPTLLSARCCVQSLVPAFRLKKRCWHARANP